MRGSAAKAAGRNSTPTRGNSQSAWTPLALIGGTFTAEAIGETTVGNARAVLPRITGQAWIYGREELRVSPEDPFRTGFALSDTWGPQVEELG